MLDGGFSYVYAVTPFINHLGHLSLSFMSNIRMKILVTSLKSIPWFGSAGPKIIFNIYSSPDMAFLFSLMLNFSTSRIQVKAFC